MIFNSIKITIILLILFAFNLFAESEWIWSHPYPTGLNINGISFIDENTGWISTGTGNWYGEVFKTADGGVSWQKQHFFERPGESVFFLDSQNGWVGSEGFLHRTTDGGLSWDSLLVSGQEILAIEFIDSIYGSIVGYGSLIARTMNGGDDWSLQGGVLGFNNFYDVSFISPSEGWIATTSGYLFYTTTYGAYWDTVYTGQNNPIRGVQFINASDGFICADNKILKTNTSGSVWETTFQQSGETFPAIDFYSSLIASAGYSGIAVSTNSGNNWNYQTLPELPLGISTNLRCISVPSDSRVYAAGDYGELFVKEGSNPISRLSSREIDNNLNGISITEDGTIWVCGTEGVLMQSNNGGQSWLSQVVNLSYDYNDICFVSDDTGFCGGGINTNGTIIKTTNGGSDWVDITPTSPVCGYVTSIDFMDNFSGVAITESGKILYTTDGGQNWTEKTGFGATQLNRIRFGDTDRGWIVGDDGQIICFDFESDSWSEQESYTTTDLNGVYPQNSQTAWICGDFRLLFTSNTGNFWETRNQSNIYGYDLWFSDDGLTGYISSLDFYYFSSTTDGGETLTWSPDAAPEAGLTKLAFTDSENGWGAGVEGQILRFGEISVGIEESENVQISNNSLFSLSENPFTTTSSVSFNLLAPEICSLYLYDLSGRQVQTLHNGMLEGGEHSFNVNGENLSSGIYFVLLKTQNTMSTESIIRIP